MHIHLCRIYRKAPLLIVFFFCILVACGVGASVRVCVHAHACVCAGMEEGGVVESTKNNKTRSSK